MSWTSTDLRKRCEKCLEYVKIYITCFNCDAAYHIYCWKKVPGAYVTKTGQLFCCCPTSNYANTQDKPPERAIEKGDVDNYSKDLENCLIKEEDSKWNEFRCDDACLLEFMNKERFENHYSECFNKQEEFIQEIKEDNDLENCLHKEEDLEWNEFRCSACLLNFMSKGHLENHYNECSNEERISIGVFKEDKDMENRLPETDSFEPSKLKRNICPLEFIIKEHLENHSSECCNEQRGSVPSLNKEKAALVCTFHNEENFQKEFYEQSIKQHDVERSYSQLNKDNDTCIANMKRNLVLGNNKNRKLKCTVCKYSTYEKANLVEHKCIHTNERSYKCDACDYTAAHKTYLNSHILVKHSNAEKQYKCRDCEYSSYIKSQLLVHNRTHTNEKPFKCDMCDYAATQKVTLKRHILRKHSDAEKQYKCRDCEYSTHTKSNLLEHKRTHTNEKPFKCDMCDYTVARKRGLKTHIIVKHSNAEKWYKCGHCKYATHLKECLLRHQYSHSTERPYKCTMCDYAAKLRIYLNDHISRRHSKANKGISAEVENIPLKEMSL